MQVAIFCSLQRRTCAAPQLQIKLECLRVQRVRISDIKGKETSSRKGEEEDSRFHEKERKRGEKVTDEQKGLRKKRLREGAEKERRRKPGEDLEWQLGLKREGARLEVSREKRQRKDGRSSRTRKKGLWTKQRQATPFHHSSSRLPLKRVKVTLSFDSQRLHL